MQDDIRFTKGKNEDFQQSVREVKDLAKKLTPFLTQEAKLLLDECVNQYERQDIVVMVAGEVSVGKSSFLNVLLGRPILLTDLTETTAAITYLRTSDGDRNARPNMAKVTYNDARIEWLPLNKAELTKVTTSLKNDDALHKVRKVEVYVPGTIPPGITIVDTPGLNGGNKHSELTHREMGLCHAALFLLDATKTGMKSESQELNRLYDYAPKVLFVLNKWDDVRNARLGRSLDAIKLEYLDSIGKIVESAENGMEVSAENIYVVSAKEGLQALEKYKKEKSILSKKGKKLTKDIRSFLPDGGNQNEIFDLFADLVKALNENEKTKMLRLRPILTMKNLAANALDCLNAKIKQEEDTREIDLEIRYLQNELEKKKQEQLERNHRAAEKVIALAQEEQQELKDLVNASVSPILAKLREFIENTPEYVKKDARTLQSSDFQQKVQGYLSRLVDESIRIPMKNKIQDFMYLLTYCFEQTESPSVDFPSSSQYTIRLSNISQKLPQELSKLSIMNDTEATLQNEIQSIESQLLFLEKDLQQCLASKKKLEKIDTELAKIDYSLAHMGPRPGCD